MTIATLIKLFEIKMVANNFLGDAKSLLTFCSDFISDELSISFSLGLSEKMQPQILKLKQKVKVVPIILQRKRMFQLIVVLINQSIIIM